MVNTMEAKLLPQTPKRGKLINYSFTQMINLNVVMGGATQRGEDDNEQKVNYRLF